MNEERSLFYLSRMFAENFKKGEDYSSLETCIHISILGFSLMETESFYSIIELRNRKTGRLYSDKLSLRVVYLNQLQYASEAERQTDVYQWAKMISAKDWEVLRTMAEQNEAMREAFEEVERINRDSALRWQYLKEEMRASDEATLRHGCYLDGAKSEAGRYSQLILKLAADGRQDEIIKAAANPDILNKLYAEYDI